MNESNASSHWRSSRLRRRHQSSNQVYHTVQTMIVHSMARPFVVSYTSSWLELRQPAYADDETLKATNAVSLTAGALQAADTRS